MSKLQEFSYMYEYKGRLIRVIDSNTIEAYINLGFDITIIQKIKLYGVPSYITDKHTVKNVPKDFIIHTIYNRRGKVGRVLGYIFTSDHININELLTGLHK